MDPDLGPFWPWNDKRSMTESGMTLVELLVATVVIGIIVVILMQITRLSYSYTDKSRSMSVLVDEVHSAGEQITDDLRTMTNRLEMSGYNFRFVGLDGDGQFQHTFDTDERPDSLTHTDHLHLHATEPDTDTETGVHGRLQLCYYLNDGDHPHVEAHSGGNPQWALLRRERRNPEPSLDRSDIDNTDPIGFNIDYLSFRYYDSDTNEWYNEWDSEDTSLDQVDYRGEFPSAVEYAVRGYSPDSQVDPEWYISTVTLGENE